MTVTRTITPFEALSLGRAARLHYNQSIVIRNDRIYYERDQSFEVGYVCIDQDTRQPIAVDSTGDRDAVFCRL